LRRALADGTPRTLAGIDAVPIQFEAQLLNEGTPFSTYLAIHDVVRAAKRRLHWLDPYLNDDVFPLHLRNLDRSVEVRLVTTPGTAIYGVQNMLAAAKSAAAEFTDFKLIECAHGVFHDRNIRGDDVIYSLGPSAKDAGRRPTNFSLGQSTPPAHTQLDGILAKRKQVP
jgi:hypothetical protein